MNSKLKFEYKELKNIIEFLKKKADDISKKEFNDPDKLENQIEEWKSEIERFVQENLSSYSEDLLSVFRSYKRENFILFNLKNWKNFESKEEEQISYLKHKFSISIESFNVLVDYISIIDPLKNGKGININSIQDKILFVLDKLYDLYNDKYYSVNLILELNDIDFRDDEPLEIATDLSKRGYAIKESEYAQNDLIKISVRGASYIERKRKAKKKKPNNNENIDDKIDEVLKKLAKLGYGQEIIFNEIDELREDSKKLSKKSFAQLVKGKVVDLALSNIINPDTAKYIYETIVDSKFKLLP
tara:strand:+ start:741 stop:1643 length:903 start_codon:yes stop_codon:yes gene_type:complete